MLDVKLDKRDPLPLYDQVCAEIRRAIADGEIGPAQLFALSRIDEDYQASKWGRDHEAEIRASNLAREIDKAAEFLAASSA